MLCKTSSVTTVSPSLPCSSSAAFVDTAPLEALLWTPQLQRWQTIYLLTKIRYIFYIKVHYLVQQLAHQ